MKPFLTTKRKLIDLAVLFILNIVFYLLWMSVEFNVLFSLGFVWNWVASQDMSLVLENKRYRFSTLKMVFNLQLLILKPLGQMPHWVQWVARLLPAGILWSMIIYFNDSQMPWWATFIGSLAFELSQIDMSFWKNQKENLS